MHHDGRDLLGALADQVRGLAHDFRAVIGRHRAPDGEALFGGGQRAIEIGLGGMRQIGEGLAGRRIDHFLGLARAAVQPFAVDMQLQVGIHELSSGFLTNGHVQAQ